MFGTAAFGQASFGSSGATPTPPAAYLPNIVLERALESVWKIRHI